MDTRFITKVILQSGGEEVFQLAVPRKLVILVRKKEISDSYLMYIEHKNNFHLNLDLIDKTIKLSKII